MTKSLTKEEKQKIIDDWNKGIEHPDYIVYKNNMGICVRKRKYTKKKKVGESEMSLNGIVNKTEVKEPDEAERNNGKGKDKSWMNAIHYYNLNNTIDMMSRNIRDLDERLTKYTTKQVKLKGKYKELKKAIYDDDEEEMELETVTKVVPPVIEEEIRVEEEPEDEKEEIEQDVMEFQPAEMNRGRYIRRSRGFNFGSYF